MNANDLDELIPLAQAGDEAAQNALAALLRPVLSDWAIKRFGPARGHISSSDVVQEVLAKVLQKLSTFRGGNGAASFWSWLETILANCINNQAHRDGAQKRSPTGARVTVDDAPADDPSPSAGLRADDRHRRIAAALDRLDPGDRRLVVGHYFEGKSYAELADELQLSTHVVKKHLDRARKELREPLGEDA
jgi:RNA polymerase sigma-70 factor, ECF subfamily